jgi:WD40-like Beta Propeller Repeat
MSVELDLQLQEYCRIMDEAQGVLTMDDILERSGELQVIGRRSPIMELSKRKWLATTAAAVALLLVAVILRFLPLRDDTPDPAFTTSPPANGLIAVSANPDDVGGGEFGDIYLVGEGTAAQRIIGSDGDGIAQACPAFSPDGQRLAYGEARASDLPVTTFRGEWPVTDRAVVVVELDSNGKASPPIMRVVAGPDPGPVPCPEWSPSGEHVAFRVGSELWVADAASGNTVVFAVTRQPGWEQNELEWSRDGSTIAVSEPGRIRMVRMDGGESSLIAVEGGNQSVDGASPVSLGWTADDERIVYINADPFDGLAVNVVGVDGSNDIQLTPDDVADLRYRFYDAVVSSDGTGVAYIQRTNRCTSDGCSGAVESLVIMDLVDLSMVEPPIPAEFGAFGLQWSPDGERLLLGSIQGVVSVAVTPGLPDVIYSRGELNLEWSPGELSWQPVFP